MGIKGKEYKLPGEFALALGSGRGELAGLAANAVRGGKLVLSVETQCELIRLVGDLIDEASNAIYKKEHVREALGEIEDMRDSMRDHFKSLIETLSESVE